MNTDIIKGKWQQLKGKLKTRWARLTDDDLTYIEGNADLAIGRIQERYGIAKDAAKREWDAFCQQCETPADQRQSENSGR